MMFEFKSSQLFFCLEASGQMLCLSSWPLRSRHDSRVNSMALVREGEILPDKLGKLMEVLGELAPEQGLS